MFYSTGGSEHDTLTSEDLRTGLYKALDKLGERKKVLVIPPDHTRLHSHAGELTRYAYEYYGRTLTDILPALGTHSPMSRSQLKMMFGKIPKSLFRVHNWRSDITTLGNVPASFISSISNGKLTFDWPAQVNKLLITGGFDTILSIGQVVPHEVIGMANYNKNIFVGTGGAEGIHKSHFLGAVYGMEKIMGKADNPVRSVLNYASEHFGSQLPPVIYVLTVVGRDDADKLVVRGLYIGDDEECFQKASDLSLKVNFEILEEPLKKVVVFLDPVEYQSTWLGNKAIYRTRMAMADGGELIILAPGIKEFGEDEEIDRLIRKYGYFGTIIILTRVENHSDLANNLAAAAHLIHGSSEGRFKITYCPGKLSKKEIEQVGFSYGNLKQQMDYFQPEKLHDGFNILPNGEKIFFISNPALGLWSEKAKFN